MNLRYHINYDEVVRATKEKDSPKNITDVEVLEKNSEWTTILIATEMAKLPQKCFHGKESSKERKRQLIRKVMKITSLTNIFAKERW